LPAPARRKPVALENLVYAALVAYSCYLDPETAKPCEPEQLIVWVGWQRVMRERFPAIIYAQGFSAYKKPLVRRFFQGSQVVFDDTGDAIPAHATVTLWGRQAATASIEAAKTVRLEDGFIRSVGLGADLVPPLSWAMDTRGIYYDATCASDLEHLLEHSEFDLPLIDRARQLRVRLVAEGLTKYNVGIGGWQRPEGNHAAVILVPGQVESDASLAFGALAIRNNCALLKAVRVANPQAYVIYKPHPDVVAGLRQAGQGEQEASRWCDEIIVDVAMAQLLLQVDEVHTLTSLTGFEALLRGKKVVCYGLPFYAGWGLTTDVLTLERRTRKLSLDELVAGVLILYPVYVSRTTGKFTTPERALDELLLWRENTAPLLPWWRKVLRGLLKLEQRINALF
jgi:capsular polysaccharide export protein